MTSTTKFRTVLGGFGIASRALYLALTAEAAIGLAIFAVYGALS